MKQQALSSAQKKKKKTFFITPLATYRIIHIHTERAKKKLNNRSEDMPGGIMTGQLSQHVHRVGMV